MVGGKTNNQKSVEVRPAWLSGDISLDMLLVWLTLTVLCLDFAVEIRIPLRRLENGQAASIHRVH